MSEVILWPFLSLGQLVGQPGRVSQHFCFCGLRNKKGESWKPGKTSECPKNKPHMQASMTWPSCLAHVHVGHYHRGSSGAGILLWNCACDCELCIPPYWTTCKPSIPGRDGKELPGQDELEPSTPVSWPFLVRENWFFGGGGHGGVTVYLWI